MPTSANGWRNRRPLLVLMAALALAIGCFSASAAADNVSISGYYKSFFVVLDEPAISQGAFSVSQSLYGAANNRLRLNLFGRVNSNVALTLAYDLAPKLQDESLFGGDALIGTIEGSSYRAGDLDARLYPDDISRINNFAVYQNLDRAFLTINTLHADFYLGRQAIAWGSAHAINSTDVLAPFTYNELDIEDRRGVDAVRARVPLGFMGEIDAGYVFGDEFEFRNSAMFLRSKFYYRRTDVSLMLVGFRENLLAGLDLTRAAGGAGTWLETAYTFAGALSDRCRNNDDDYLRLSLGADYSLRDGTYLFVEYHFNQAGSGDPAKYLDLLTHTAYTDGAVYLLGEHYLIPGVSRQLTPLITATGEALVNLREPSLLFAPGIEYNIAENIYLAAGAYIGLGKGPELVGTEQSDPTIRLRSEFGSYPDIYFTSFRVYF